MNWPCIHVVGAGIAGLSAGLAATRQGESVVLYEAASQAGGRCRTLEGPGGITHDNGTHVLFTGNRAATALLTEIGARADWIEPEPDGCPVYDARSGRLTGLGLSPWSWFRQELRPDGFTAGDLTRLLRILLPLADVPVGALMRGSAIADTLVEPLTVAVLNTPMAVASSRRLGMALRRLAWPGAARLLVARRGLSADLVDPAVVLLRQRSASFHAGRRLRAITREGDHATGLVFGDRAVPLGPGDRVVLALPPWEIARLLPELSVPDAFEAILNVHFPIRGPDRPRFIGLRHCLAQWALVRDDHVSVTVSAARDAIDESSDVLLSRVWRDVAPALRALGVEACPNAPGGGRVVKEKRATIRQSAGPLHQPPLRPLANMALAGDWIGSLPATIESAVVSGERAIRTLSRRGRARSSSSAWPALTTAGGTR